MVSVFAAAAVGHLHPRQRRRREDLREQRRTTRRAATARDAPPRPTARGERGLRRPTATLPFLSSWLAARHSHNVGIVCPMRRCDSQC